MLAKLGQGGMGTVYRARDPILDRQVALKTISPAQLAKPDALARFQREARAAARLQHPNIVTIYELGEVGGTYYIAMELLLGMDLGQALNPPDRIPIAQKLRLAVELCRGLDYAHKHGVLHRDVKPANVLILADGSAKIVDFGIARLDGTQMTSTGVILGTPSYLAPETLLHGQVDHRSDMWAAGVVLFEMVACRRPFVGPSYTELANLIVRASLPALDMARLGAPAGVSSVIERALAKEPAERFRDMAEMADALEAAQGVTASENRLQSDTAREGVLSRHVAAARRLMTHGDLEAALLDARRAQALAPSDAEIVGLIRDLEERLSPAERTPALPPPPPSRSKSSVNPSPRSVPPDASTRVAAPVKATVLDALRERGAAAFRELALFGEPPATSTACLSPARDLLALAGTDGAMRFWDLQTRMRTATLRTEMHRRSGHDAVALCLAFSADGRLLASGHADGAVHLWDVESGALVPVKLRHEGLVGSVAFSPDAATLASGGMDMNLKLWDVRAALAGEARRELHRQPSGVTALAYAGAGGRLLVTGHPKVVLRVLDARTGRLVATLRGPEAQINLLVASPDARRIAAASHDRSIRVFDLDSRSEVFQAVGHRTRSTASLAFFRDGRHLASAALDNSIQLWDTRTQAAIATLWGQSTESYAGVAVFAGGECVAAALADGRVRLWGPAA